MIRNRAVCVASVLLAVARLLADDDTKKPTPFADRVVMFQKGDGGGKGEKLLPDVVLGPPKGGGKLMAGTDVLSLGHGGWIILEFVDNEIVDEEGDDLLVFENPFLAAPGNDPTLGFFELGKVEVSEDGQEWKQFAYDTGTRKGCAGWHPVLSHPDKAEILPTNPEQAGGDAFDLKEVGLKVARFVRITDLNNSSGAEGTVGFDLDAVAAVHSRARKPAK
jgi:hypothetical protein